MKRIFLCAIFFSPLGFVSAQNTSPYWSLAGNSNASASSKLGTTNNFPLRFFANNTERMTIQTNGRVGIGTTNPLNIFTVKSTAGSPGTVWVSGSPVFYGFTESASSELNLGAATNTPDLRPVFAGKRSRGTLASPKVVVPNDYIVSYTGAAYDGSRFQFPAGIQFYVDGTPSAGHVPARISFETGTTRADRLERLKILNNGDFDFNGGQLYLTRSTGALAISASAAIGTGNPGSYRLKIVHSTFGVNIENATTLDDWEFWSNSGGLSLYANGNFRGNFNPTTGVYTPVSDERLKTSIKSMTTIMDKIMQLKPSTYQFKNMTNKIEYNGFIAQDVMKIFPSMVTHNINKDRNLDVYTLDYNAFGVIAIKGIQELQPVVEEQKVRLEKVEDEYESKISMLEARISKLEAALANISGNIPGAIDNLSLAQNTPNPFNKNTTIRYTIPHGSKGQILVYDPAGKLVKTFFANESGQTVFSGYDLPAGTYSYTLTINGKTVLTKQMLVIK